MKVVIPPALWESTVEVEENVYHIDQSCVVKYTNHSLGELKLGKTSGNVQSPTMTPTEHNRTNRRNSEILRNPHRIGVE